MSFNMQVKVRTASWLGHSLPRTTRCLCFASHSKHSTATLNFKKERSKKPVLGCLVKNLWREATEQAKQVGCFRREIAAGFQSTIAACFAAAILFLQISVAHAAEDSLTVRFKASKDPEIRRVQEALVEAWGYVGTQYLDPKINGVDWPKELQARLDESFEAKKPGDVYKVINAMLGKLGDPFTRVIPPSVAGAFENATEGQIMGMGFQVAQDQEDLLRVELVKDDSPAQRGGIQPGDILLTVDGKAANKMSKQELAALLRTEADVSLRRNSDSEPSEFAMHLKAQPLEVHPVQYALLPRSGDGGNIGYVRLVVFSKNAAHDVEQALTELQDRGVEAVLLDLRDNVGGVVLSAYQVTQLFLPQGARFCFVEDGRGASEDVKMLESHQTNQTPMVVLVNGGTASSAELVAASLHDNHRATLLGEKTFGKGRTQRIVRLRDGGLLLLSNTLYLTPEHQSVDKVGLTPDIACKPEATETAFWSSGDQSGSEALLQDPCVKMAMDRLNSAQPSS